MNRHERRPGVQLDHGVLIGLQMTADAVGDEVWFEQHPERRYHCRITSEAERRWYHPHAAAYDPQLSGYVLTIIHRITPKDWLHVASRFIFKERPAVETFDEEMCRRLWDENGGARRMQQYLAAEARV